VRLGAIAQSDFSGLAYDRAGSCDRMWSTPRPARAQSLPYRSDGQVLWYLAAIGVSHAFTKTLRKIRRPVEDIDDEA
jgi:hypothetical protein